MMARFYWAGRSKDERGCLLLGRNPLKDPQETQG